MLSLSLVASVAVQAVALMAVASDTHTFEVDTIVEAVAIADSRYAVVVVVADLTVEMAEVEIVT